MQLLDKLYFYVLSCIRKFLIIVLKFYRTSFKSCKAKSEGELQLEVYNMIYKSSFFQSEGMCGMFMQFLIQK